MLYEFYTHENKKKPGSVHATYVLHGTQSAKASPMNGASQQDGEDVSMTSSPFMSSSIPQDEDMVEPPPVKVMTVVREENLEGVASTRHLLPTDSMLNFGSCESKIRRDSIDSHLHFESQSAQRQSPKPLIRK